MKAKTIIILLVLGGAAIGGVVFYQYTAKQQQLIETYNRIVEQKVNQGRYRQGYQDLDELLTRTTGGKVEKAIHQTMALCARAIGDDPSIPLSESGLWYERAEQHDPGSLDEMQRKAMQLYQRQQNQPAQPAQ
jgi:hypothetical protein